MKKVKVYKGGNGDFAQAFNQYAGTQLTAKVLKQLMKQWRFCLEDQGVRFVNRRSNGRRLVEVFYTPPGDEGDGGDAETPGTGKKPGCAPVRPLSAPGAPGGVPPRPGPEKALWGRWAGFGGDNRPGEATTNRWGGNRRPCRSLRPWRKGKRDAKPFPF